MKSNFAGQGAHTRSVAHWAIGTANGSGVAALGDVFGGTLRHGALQCGPKARRALLSPVALMSRNEEQAICSAFRKVGTFLPRYIHSSMRLYKTKRKPGEDGKVGDVRPVRARTSAYKAQRC